MTEDHQKFLDQRIKGYLFIKNLDNGSFGSVYLAKDKDDVKYAIKVEKINEKKKKSNKNYLMNEFNFYRKNLKDSIYVPQVFKYFEFKRQHFMVMQLCGPNLHQIMTKKCKKRFSVQCIEKIACVIIDIIKEVHERSIIYKDIKPDNFMTTYDNSWPFILIIDFGLSKEYFF